MANAKREAATPLKWTADQVELRPVSSLVPYARNARTHSPAQVEQIAKSLRRFRWTIPILIDEEDGIVAGHGRLLGADIIYRAGETIKTVGGGELPIGHVPVLIARGWTEAEKRAYILADNKLAENAGWDDAMLKLELVDLQALDIDLTLLGFGTDEIGKLIEDPMPPDEFQAYGEDIETAYCCPRCRFKWSGKPDPGAEAA